jgi:hypothetical protein
MMSTCCSKHVEAWNKYIKKECVKLVINQSKLQTYLNVILKLFLVFKADVLDEVFHLNSACNLKFPVLFTCQLQLSRRCHFHNSGWCYRNTTYSVVLAFGSDIHFRPQSTRAQRYTRARGKRTVKSRTAGVSTAGEIQIKVFWVTKLCSRTWLSMLQKNLLPPRLHVYIYMKTINLNREVYLVYPYLRRSGT